MFGLLRSSSFSDPELGSFERSRGRWRGRFTLAGKSISLALVGTRGAPDATALVLAKGLPAAWSQNLEAVARALIEHFAPYEEAFAAGAVEPPSRPLPAITRPSDVWQFVDLQSASVTPMESQAHFGDCIGRHLG